MDMHNLAESHKPRFSNRLDHAGFALGFGLGGFFDGILLHQVLQWHHLLSGLEQVRGDIRLLILADGLFHVLMYVVCGLGLWLLWSARSQHAGAGQDRRLFAAGLIGFGGWHILDSILSHWILGIHRIRMDTENPLFWDLLWLVLFGIVPCLIGWMIRRNGPGGRRSHAPVILTLAVALTAPVASLPAPRETTVMILFAPGTPPTEAFAALQSVDGRLLWMDPTETLWAVDLSTGSTAREFYRHGALLVTSSILPLGCFNWIKA